ncbi:MAG: GNAT family N-acetyltransferase [Oscillospiraceae bacterium]|jgi:GNAT superfamily N-acetyltransferase|nr:GNAT family N-acetyltransferase [Oscillospiraceae bacterium]
MNITHSNTISAADYNALREAVGWGVLPAEQAQRGIDGSTFVVAASDAGHAVGVARVLYDGGSAALIKDVIVLPEYQRREIGTELMNRVMEFLRGQLKPGWHILIDLSATKGKEPFYEKFGFELRPNERFGDGMAMWIGDKA